MTAQRPARWADDHSSHHCHHELSHYERSYCPQATPSPPPFPRRRHSPSRSREGRGAPPRAARARGATLATRSRAGEQERRRQRTSRCGVVRLLTRETRVWSSSVCIISSLSHTNEVRYFAPRVGLRPRRCSRRPTRSPSGSGGQSKLCCPRMPFNLRRRWHFATPNTSLYRLLRPSR